MTSLIAETSIAVFPGQMLALLARIVDKDGNLLSSSDFSSIRLEIFNLDDPSTAITLGGLATGIAIATSQATNTLTTSGSWSRVGTGYNFSYSYNSGTALKGSNRYRAEVKATTASLGIIYMIFNINVKAVSQT